MTSQSATSAQGANPPGRVISGGGTSGFGPEGDTLGAGHG